MEKNGTAAKDMSGQIHMKINSATGTNKIKSGKKSYWLTFRPDVNQLAYYKNAKDVETKDPIELLDLYGGGVSYGNTDDNEFLLSIRGAEYQFNADSHKTMMKWMNLLQKQVKVKGSVVVEHAYKTSTLESVPEEEALDIKRTGSVEKKPKKRASFLHRLFSRKSKSKTSKDSSSSKITIDHEKEVKPAPHRSVVGSMQDLSSSKSGSCKSCMLLENRNQYLNEQIKELNEDIENINEQQRLTIRLSEHKDHDTYSLKLDYISFLQKSLSQDDENYTTFKSIPQFKQVLRYINKEEELKHLYKVEEDSMQPFTDDHGFSHGGSRESPLQYLINLCQIIKNKYRLKLQESEEMYNKWTTYSSSLTLDKHILNDNTIKVLVQYGIPNHLRSKVWKICVLNRVNDIISEKGDNYYASLIEKLPNLEDDSTEDDGSIEKQIKIDLLRTMPTHSEFQNLNKDKIPILHRILRAYLLHNPTINYSQGMNFMVGFSLLVLDEETSFWLLVAITEVFFSKNHYNMYLSGSQANQKVLEHLCYVEMADLMSHIDEITCQISPVTFNWFMTIFIDSLPVDLVMQIWDCFLVYGHEVLYRFGFVLLKLHKKSLLRTKDPLSLMRKLKKMGRTFYEVEDLFAEVFNGEFKFDEIMLIELYEKYLLEIEEENRRRKEEDEEFERVQQKKKFTPRAMMVSISDNLDQLDDDLIIKCAECEANRNFVWLCCSSDLMGQLFIMNVASRTTFPVGWQVDCKCLDMARLPTANVMLVSTIKSTLYAVDIETKKELWNLQLAGSALSISCDTYGNVILSLMDGSIAILCIKGKELHQTYPTYLDISISPVLCGCLIDEHYWCGAANEIFIVDITTLERERSVNVCGKSRHAVTELVPSQYGVWSSVKNSAVLHLWDVRNYTCLLTVDILDACGLGSEKKIKSLSGTSITSIMCIKDKLWVGFANGRFIITNILEQNNNSDDDLNDVINLFKTSMENLTDSDKMELSKMKKSPSKLGVSYCCHQIVGEEEEEVKENMSRLSQVVNEDIEFAVMDKRDSNYSIALKMNQIQRVSEQPVDCFLPCRNDGKLILTCMGALNDDSSVILWSSEKRDGREMWFAQTVSYSE